MFACPATRRALAAASVAALLSIDPAGIAQERPPVPAFRSKVMLVPVDVRVLDRQGRPVTDLTERDFAIIEDGVPQTIRHFSAYSLDAEPPEPGARPDLREAPSDRLTPQRRRIFLLAFGRGRLQYPSKGVDAALTFVRERLLPQDQVAVLAYNRATDFTTEHERVAAVIERFRAGHEDIEARLAHWFSGLTAVYGSRDIPPHAQRAIDDLFAGPDAIGSRTLIPVLPTDAAGLRDDLTRGSDARPQADLVLARGGAFDALDLEPVWRNPSMPSGSRSDWTFEDHVARSVQTLQDLGNLYTGVEYLRYLEGEKHLVLFTERGLFLPRVENDRYLAALASDARVVIDTIQTGGLPGGPPMGFRGPVPLPGPTFAQTFAVQSLRNISDLSGGQAAIYRDAGEALERIDRATRSGYLLGYYPADPAWDGRYRRIEVKVTRPDISVRFRHGYYARDTVVPTERRAFLTYTRVAAAGGYPSAVSDLSVAVTAREEEIRGAVPDVVADITVGAKGVSLVDEHGLYTGSLEIALFLGDRKERLVGERWQTLDLRLSEDTRQAFVREGASYTVRIPARARARWVKAIVYDHRADLVGTAVARLR